MNEDTNNNIVDSGNLDQIEEAIDSLSQSVDKQSDADAALLKEIKKINEYNAKQEKQQAADRQAAETQAKQDEQEQQAADQEAQEQAEIDAQTAAEKEAAEQEHQETTQEILVDIRSELELQNELSAVNGIYFGIICGLLFIKILIDRLIRV